MKLPKISILIIHFNRINHLKNTLNSILSKVNYSNLEIIIADDFSKSEIRKTLLDIRCDVLILNQKNSGLGKNTNNAIKVCTGEYILQLQDDWDFIGARDILKKSVKLLQENAEIEMVRFYNSENYPLIEFSEDFVFCNKDQLNEQQLNTLYSDTPHLKRKSFHDKYGYYLEGVPMTETEIKFAENFKLKFSGIILFTPKDQFKHTGESNSFNPYQIKKKCIQNLRKYFILNIFFNFYFSIKSLIKKILKKN